MGICGLPTLCILLVCLLTQCAEVVCQNVSNLRPFEAALPIYVFHGSFTDQHGDQQVAIVHVLVKAKRQVGGSFLMRTVSFTTRPDLQGGHLAEACGFQGLRICCSYTAHLSSVCKSEAVLPRM